ncbi:hypothetical protein KGQ27_03485 [Patescibacteria group bacterium]|nr:hypothetical protein [Patescibacteria group bacterium]MDE1946915.1 hypothetical protein [Patescibacteria group bacterium]MDE2011116.1 hypothetical protein [Patescibacteria group bacterium]MDE2233192.1 hypothetical protein [Patescibacteria group bacterium]
MKTVLWVSRHPVNGIQLPALRRMFGANVQVVEDLRPFDSAEQIVARYRQGSFADMIVVVPLSVLAKIVELGVRPLWSQAGVVNEQKLSDWSVNGRHYRFVEFRRVRKLVLEFDDLGDAAKRKGSD